VALENSVAISERQLLARDHLFISYAAEDRPLAEWLTRKLTADGYRVWCDRFSLLGGDSYPKNIDVAIKERAFRVIAILSKASINKPNPVKERTLALNLAQARNENFLIPINVNLNATQLDWMTSDLTYISFSNWAQGYAHLLETLAKVVTPRPLEHLGRSVAIETFRADAPIRNEKEILYTNCIPFTKIPPIIRAFSTNRSLTRDEFIASPACRKAYRVNSRTYLSFERTLTGLARDVFCQADGQWLWGEDIDILGVPALNIVSALLRRSFLTVCVRKGLCETPDGKSLYFPWGLLKDNKIYFTGFNGKTWLLVVGQRVFQKLQGHQEICIHHLSFRFHVRKNLFETFILQLKVGLHLTDLTGATFKPRTFNSRRKKITKNWWNDKWLNRHLAICEFLNDASGVCLLGDTDESRILLSTNLINVQAPFGIDEDSLGVDPDEFGLAAIESEILETDDEIDVESADE